MVTGHLTILVGKAIKCTVTVMQVHRVNRAVRTEVNSKGERVVVSASYEDPSQPDIILNRVIRADDYLAANARGGANERQQCQSTIVFLFSYWEHSIRPRLGAASGNPERKVDSDIMGDLNQVRHAILHDKGIMPPTKHAKLKLIGHIFPANEPVFASYDHVHEIFSLIKKDMARLFFDWIGRDKIPFDTSDIVSIAIQRGGNN